MQEFDKISISEMSKEDMLMIIEALEYTGKGTNKIKYLSLRDSIINELIYLSESNENDFIKYLRSNI